MECAPEGRWTICMFYPGPASDPRLASRPEVWIMDQPYDIEVFFDGQCPLCTREMAFLRRRDKKWRVRLQCIPK